MPALPASKSTCNQPSQFRRGGKTAFATWSITVCDIGNSGHMKMERKLSAILAADVVGYSALMERDEAGTFDRLEAAGSSYSSPRSKSITGEFSS